jgi:DNA (cytosine-5)-methyltransferase 1
MSLWQEIIFLKNFFDGLFVVENVISYYEPLIKPYKFDRHYFWTNFYIPNNQKKNDFNICNMRESTRELSELNIKKLESLHGFNLRKYSGVDKTKLLRNCVNPKTGLYIFNCAFKTKQKTLEV